MMPASAASFALQRNLSAACRMACVYFSTLFPILFDKGQTGNFRPSALLFLQEFPLSVLFYPFKPLVAMPSMKYFCKQRNTTDTGSSDTRDAAMIR